MGILGSLLNSDSDCCRSKKLIAGIRFNLQEDAGKWDCSDCDEKQRDRRNCRNRHRLKHPYRFADDWSRWAKGAEPKIVKKVFDLRFYVCPVDCISRQTWSILRLVNSCLDAEGNILQLPTKGALLDQPPWFLLAARIISRERSQHQLREIEDRKRQHERNKKKQRGS